MSRHPRVAPERPFVSYHLFANLGCVLIHDEGNPVMSSVTFTRSDGSEVTVEAVPGDSVMTTAVDNDVEGIVGQCGGALACASCHVYVDPAWIDVVGPPSEMEDEMLDGALAERRASSRLSCQLPVGPERDGLRVEIAPEQM